MLKDLNVILSYTKLTDSGCLEWIRAKTSDGYPRAVINGNNNAKIHRIVYELCFGEIPSGAVVMHKCDNPICINPEHLSIGSHAENIRDRDLKQRHGASKLTHTQVKSIRWLYKHNHFNQKELAAIFKVNRRTISSIVNFKHFKYVV